MQTDDKSAEAQTRPRLNRSAVDAPKAPVRIVHMGVGAFARAHQAWYTAHAEDASDWGIAAFTGRRPLVADLLSPQDGLYTLVERAGTGDSYEVVGSISEVHPGSDLETFFDLLAAPSTAIVTLTLTEAGYKLDASGTLNRNDAELQDDLDATRGKVFGDRQLLLSAAPKSALVRLTAGLGQRAKSGNAPIAIVSCDNVLDNGVKLRQAVMQVAGELDPSLPVWIDDNVSFVSTSIDRITPRTDDETVEQVSEATGLFDAAPVVTEPFSDWVLSGDFPAGRPKWETKGATFTDEIEPYELRKLWLLNGAHSLLAYMGLLEGHTTVAEAIADSNCKEAVEAWWDEASANLPAGLGLEEYRGQLTKRFLNPRIAHRLEQIGNDGLTKLRQRVLPVAKLELEQGRDAAASATTIAKWIVASEGDFAFTDALEEEILPVRQTGQVSDWVGLLDEDLGADEEFVALVQQKTELKVRGL